MQDGPALILDLLGSCFTDQLRPPLLTPADVASYLEQDRDQHSSSGTELDNTAGDSSGEGHIILEPSLGMIPLWKCALSLRKGYNVFL